MLKKGIFLGLIILTIVLTSGCTSGASLPTLREETSILDDTVAKYDNAMSLYRQDDYARAKAEFVEAVSGFKDCQSKFDEIAKSDLTELEKKDAGKLASSSLQFAYASAYMRDACTEAMNEDGDGYYMEVSASEYETTARNLYEANKAELEQFWSSQ